jgi:hypothetical protein
MVRDYKKDEEVTRHDIKPGVECCDPGDDDGFEEVYCLKLLTAAGGLIVGSTHRHSHCTVYVGTGGDAALLGATLNVYAKTQNGRALILSTTMTTQAALAAQDQAFTPSPDTNPCDGYDVEILPAGTPTIPTRCTLIAHGWEVCCADDGGGGGTPQTGLEIFVNPGGQDSPPGDGTLLFPFLTIGHATQIAKTIPTRSPTRPVGIFTSPGTFTENVLVPKNTFIVAQDPSGNSTNVVGTLGLDPEWATAPIGTVGGTTGITWTGAATFNFTGGLGESQFFAYATGFGGAVTVTGDPTNGGFLAIEQSSTLNISVVGATLNTSGSLLGAGSASTIGIASTAAQPATWLSSGDSILFNTAVTIDATAGKNVTTTLVNSQYYATGTLTVKNGGGGVVTYTGAAPSTVTLVGGASLAVAPTPLISQNSNLQTGGHATSGYLATADGAGNVTWNAPPSGGFSQLTGDVTAGPGSGSQAATVVAVNGATVPAAAGSLTVGTVLRVTGVSALGYGAVDLSNVNAVVNNLPITNIAPGSNSQVLITSSVGVMQWRTMAGDVTGNIGTTVVGQIHGASVPASGALTTGNVLQVTGVSALSYAALNLAGGANYVTGTLPIGNLPFGTAAQIPVTNSGATALAFVSLSADATISAAGAVAVTAARSGLYTFGAAGSAGITTTNAINAPWVFAITAPASGSSTVAGQATNFTGQAGGQNTAASGTAGAGGAFTLTAGAGGVESGTTSTGGAGGAATLAGGAGGSGTTIGGVGGNVILAAGAAGTGGSAFGGLVEATATGVTIILASPLQSSTATVGTATSQANKTQRIITNIQTSSAAGVVMATVAVPSGVSISGLVHITARFHAANFSTGYLVQGVSAVNNAGTLAVNSGAVLAFIGNISGFSVTVQASSTNFTVTVTPNSATTTDWELVLDLIYN